VPESSLLDVLLPTLRGDDVPDAEERLLMADPSGSEATLMHLARIGAVEASAHGLSLDRLMAWANGASDPESEALVGTSGLLAEQLEAALDEAGAGTNQRLAAAGGSAGVEVWPATYAAGPWSVLVGLDEADRLYIARLTGSGSAELRLAGLDPLPLPDEGDAAVLGPAEEILGGPAEFNPWTSIGLSVPGGLLALERDDS
jgi:hypothetical protein